MNTDVLSTKIANEPQRNYADEAIIDVHTLDIDLSIEKKKLKVFSRQSLSHWGCAFVEPRNTFQATLANLTKTKHLEKPLENRSKVDIRPRKRIQLDHLEIQNIEKKHKDTVELLNDYLCDDEEPPQTKTNIHIMDNDSNNSLILAKACRQQVQKKLVKMIRDNSFKIHQSQVDKYANKNGMFKNQLIDSINEAYENFLEGEALIEEDGENYRIEESYYQKLQIKLWH